jgi:SAM-dependent methyltransferase
MAWRDLAPRDAVARFAVWLGDEITARRADGYDVSYLTLKYEGPLFTAGGGMNRLGIEGYAARLAPMIDAIRRRGHPRLLDAGCGCGSEAILAALLGADVTALDIVGMRVDYAASRIPWYEAEIRRNGASLRFVQANAIPWLAQETGLDIIWANESVSHIHPVEEFFRAARRALNPGGALIVADSNALNPAVRAKAARIRGSRGWVLRGRFPCLDDGSHDDVADERIFTVGSMKAMLRSAGFRVTRVAMIGFLGSSIFPGAWQSSPVLAAAMAASQSILSRIPVVRLAGSTAVYIAGVDAGPGGETRKKDVGTGGEPG